MVGNDMAFARNAEFVMLLEYLATCAEIHSQETEIATASSTSPAERMLDNSASGTGLMTQEQEPALSDINRLPKFLQNTSHVCGGARETDEGADC